MHHWEAQVNLTGIAYCVETDLKWSSSTGAAKLRMSLIEDEVD